jgi:TRAP-type C4-dicarboxylate transport system permease small subunit
MRTALDKVYNGAGITAGACIVLITLMVLAQIVGRWFGIIIPSTEDFSGYLLAAASFLALAYTFRHGGHIRVTLLVHQLSSRWQRALLNIALLVFVVVVGYGAYQLGFLVYESWQFQELSQGYIAIPLWIPQLPMALGALLFFVALVDDVIVSFKGRTPSFVEMEQ